MKNEQAKPAPKNQKKRGKAEPWREKYKAFYRYFNALMANK